MNSETSTTTTTDPEGKVSTVVHSHLSDWAGDISAAWSTFHAHSDRWLEHFVSFSKGLMFLSIAHLLWYVTSHWNS